MKTKQEQIEEMANIILNSNGGCPLDESGDSFVDCSDCKYDRKNCTEMQFAEDLYSAGYRKASEVIDEFVERLKQKQFNKDLFNDWAGATYVVLVKDVDELAAEMRQEVEK